MASPGYELELLRDSTALERLADDWDRLWASTEPAPPMLEGAWVRRWWQQHGAGTELLLFVLRDAAGAPCAIAPLYRRRALDRLSLGLRTIAFIGMGEPRSDEVYGEYHAWLGPPAARAELSARLVEWLKSDSGWDRLLLPNLSAASRIHEQLVMPLGPTTMAVEAQPLPSFRTPARPLDGYLAALSSSSMRRKLKRSVKVAGERGLRFVRASSLEEGRAMFDEIANLHQQRWQEKGKPGVFSSPTFRAFHDDMIAHYARHDRLWIVGLSDGRSLIAGRYCIETRGVLYDYVSGVQGMEDNQLNPGLLLHILTIDAAAAAGLKAYDLMGGDYDFKRRLMTEEDNQLSVDAFRINPRAIAWLSARAALRRLRRGRGQAETPASPAPDASSEAADAA
jgi:CelD/BcsL family acetyltransferase involved in cellulose biosynthesis